MLILSIESSGETASAAVVTENKVLAEINIANKLTHSETLMPMIDFLLRAADINLSSVDFIALGVGPGSFTGLRIGAATAKAVCRGADKKLIPVPSLDALAFNIIVSDAIIVPVMDARRGQVYSCIYENKNGRQIKLTEYMAEDLEIIFDIVLKYEREVIFLGDGSDAFYDRILARSKNFNIAPPNLRLQRAASVGLLASRRVDEAVGHGANPLIYLRKPQAEREAENKT